MRKIIHHLRSKSERERRDILHALTVLFALILIAVWIYSLGENFLNPKTQKKIGQDLQPFSVLKNNLIGGYQSITEPNLGTQQQIQ